jgi:carbonic anhydrase
LAKESYFGEARRILTIMNRFRRVSSQLVIGLFVTSCSQPSSTPEATADPDQPATSVRPVHWSYHGEEGPGLWASLTPVYSLCGEGKYQSPINIENTEVSGGLKWSINYGTTSLRIAHNEHMDDIIDNGHTIQITVDEGSTFTFEGMTYHLKQFHFHTPSEHTIDGLHMPMEMHMVHQSDSGRLAVIGILFEEGTIPNKNFAKIIANLPNAKGESKHITDTNLELRVHLPEDNYAYHYMGSLTTPPCSEDVQWLVLRDKVSLTKEQLEAFSSRIGPNNRPPQALNGRTVKLDDIVGILE